MNYAQIVELLWEIASEMALRGPGWAQQSSVLREAAARIPHSADPRVEQLILTCWHDLFRAGRLSWGLNLDNPDAPFFHVPLHDPLRDGA